MFLCDWFQRGWGEVENTPRLLQQGAKMTSLTFISQIGDNCGAVLFFLFIFFSRSSVLAAYLIGQKPLFTEAESNLN